MVTCTGMPHCLQLAHGRTQISTELEGMAFGFQDNGIWHSREWHFVSREVQGFCSKLRGHNVSSSLGLFFFFNLKKLTFLFGRGGSSLLPAGFLELRRAGATS